MTTNAKTAKKRTAVEYLSFGAKTAKRVAWEAWEFTIVGPHLVEVTNASYGFEKDDHTYTVGVEERNGLAVPAECDCPADMYHEEYDCKHKVALATIGGKTTLDAAGTFSPHLTPSGETETEIMAKKLKLDAGELETCPHGDPYCNAPENDNLACFDCFREET
ncbi:hypothetical protein [Halorubrum sp. Hd13]|uniref:hypothetical protein n=1 Tax=Halorubrum sp. Hd13 TaxID=1480728 RepID=UPI000B99842F|nr:hypothetical protein [Halorubrum sp. Hd13]OYR39938.1 hypothetical protein DJ81_15300 [Halorubrum sp. Hd13]